MCIVLSRCYDRTNIVHVLGDLLFLLYVAYNEETFVKIQSTINIILFTNKDHYLLVIYLVFYFVVIMLSDK